MSCLVTATTEPKYCSHTEEVPTEHGPFQEERRRGRCGGGGEDHQSHQELPGTSVLHSHWSSSNETCLSLVERFMMLICQLSYAIKNQLGHPKPPTGLCLLLAGSLWHEDAYNSSFPCMEANYPYAIKNQRGISKYVGSLEARADSLWL